MDSESLQYRFEIFQWIKGSLCLMTWVASERSGSKDDIVSIDFKSSIDLKADSHVSFHLLLLVPPAKTVFSCPHGFVLQHTSSARQCAFAALADAFYVESRVHIPLHGLADLVMREHIPHEATHWSCIIQKNPLLCYCSQSKPQ